MTRERPSRKVTIRCAGCAKTQTLRPGRVEPCEGYCCCWDHGPRQAQAPGLIRRWVSNAAGGFYGWQDALPSAEEINGVRRAREILVLGQAQAIVDDAAGLGD